MARRRETNRTLYAGLAFGALVVLSMTALALSMSGLSTAPVWSLALILGTLVALVALLLLEPPRQDDAPGLVVSSCPACNKPMLEEWRLCPYCGQMLACDMSLPDGGERVHG